MIEPILRDPTALHLLRRHAVERPDRHAVTYVQDHDDPAGAHTLTYAELDAEARRIAAGIQQRCERGDRVLLLHPPGLPFVAALIGCLYAGTVGVPSPMPGQFSYQQRRIRGIALDAGARLALTDSALAGEAAQWVADERLDLPVAATDEPGFGDATRWRDPMPAAGDLAVLQYTSGSTGSPKGVMVDHRNLLHNADNQRRNFGLNDSVRIGGWIPLYHDMGLMGLLLPSLFLGTTFVFMSPMAFLKRPHHWLSMLDRFDVAFSAAPNFAYELCARRITEQQAAGLDLSRWRHACNGSEPIQAATPREFTSRFAGAGLRADAMAPCYGMAETTVFVSGSSRRPVQILPVDAEALGKHVVQPPRPGAPVRELVGCGRAADFELRVVDPADGAVLPEGGVGEIWLRGPAVAVGYWRRPEATEETFRARTADGDGPFLRTGDLGAVLDGELYITGRCKDLLIVHGRNLYPQDIEHEVRVHHPELATLAGTAFTVAAPHEEVLLLHEIRGRFDEEHLRRITTGMRATVFREFGVHTAGIVLLRPGAVHKTTSGKVQRAEMRRLFLDGALAPVYQDVAPSVLAAAGQR